MAVSFNKNREKYEVRVYRNGERHWGGYHETEEKAWRAYRKLARQLDPTVPNTPTETLEGFGLGYEHEVYLPFQFPTPTKLEVFWANLKGKLFRKFYESKLDKLVKSSK